VTIDWKQALRPVRPCGIAWPGKHNPAAFETRHTANHWVAPIGEHAPWAEQRHQREAAYRTHPRLLELAG